VVFQNVVELVRGATTTEARGSITVAVRGMEVVVSGAEVVVGGVEASRAKRRGFRGAAIVAVRGAATTEACGAVTTVVRGVEGWLVARRWWFVAWRLVE